ncbi:beta-galactosidase [Actinoalloteichus hoggarensis]|uniref:Beta-galactosidase n=1 Tax=Actinoalloteichus hoggarensis TaxID=1470176 RepID=A0A221W8Q7_9PSEU|nr:beta-galactosidase [Actinoalloteichus hoggarensis]ASO21976.1 Beta-galactosidase bgaB [Actinoalloteichus hoggarensis]MBB5923944.1 beta-galactosidase [Actinoalloteichus hoggarensis]
MSTDLAALRRRLGGLAYGCDYNPEQWPEEVWAEDMRLMRQAGVNLVSIGIFSWAKIEPRPGEYDFGWFDRLMDLLAANGIGACLATMTASPPPWMARLHPETLPVTATGVRLAPGSRQQFCPSSRVYRDYATRLVEQIATRYRDHPALALWHVNNEYGCHMNACYSDVSAAAFRDWLRDRYGDLDRLNEAWYTDFWSQGYTDWADIGVPSLAPYHPNPGQSIDFARFTSDAFLGCFLAEKEVLSRVTPDIPVTTNFITDGPSIDLFDWAGHQDLIAFDSYPDPFEADAHVAAAFHYDLMRSLRHGQPWFLMEQATAAVNWRERNAMKPPGAMRLGSWQAVAQGADAVMFFQWRASRGGTEKFHAAMVPHTGTETRIFREVCELGRELASVPELVDSRVRADTALLLDWSNWWALERDSHPSVDVTRREAETAHYTPLFEAGVTCDVVHPDRDLSGYRLVVVPNLYLLSDAAAERLRDYVRGGGHLVVSFFSGVVDENDHVHQGGMSRALRETLGLWVEEYWPLPAAGTVAVTGLGPDRLAAPAGVDAATTAALASVSTIGAAAGAAVVVSPNDAAVASPPVRGRIWSELIRLEGAESLAEFAEGELRGSPAVTRHAFGAGTAWYLGTRLDGDAMRELLAAVCAAADVGPDLALPPGVQAVTRHTPDGDRLLLLLNHGGESARVALPDPMVDVLTSGAEAEPSSDVLLPRHGVAVLRRAPA